MLSLINGVLFTLPQLANTEAEMNFPLGIAHWFLVGAGYALITLRSGSLDYVLGVHAINNLLLTIIVGYEGGSLPSIAIFMTQGQISFYDVLSLFAAIAVAYVLIDRIESRFAKKAQ